MYLHQALALTIAHEGASACFGVIGDANLFMVQSLHDAATTRYVAAASESAAVAMASGFARVSGDVGVATVTHGPAVTNTLTPLVDAVRDRTPLVLIAGDTAADDPHNLQNIDQAAALAASGARFVSVVDAERAVSRLVDAFHVARTESIPVVFNIPVNLQWAEVPDDAVTAAGAERSAAQEAAQAAPQSPSEEQLDTALGVIAASRRPIVLVGRGALDPDAMRDIEGLADRMGAPIATTLRARGALAGRPGEIGIFGNLATERAAAVIQRCDAVIAFGASLSEYTTMKGSLTEGKAVVQIDRDATAIGRFLRPTCAIVADAGETARRLAEDLGRAEISSTGFRDQIDDAPPVSARPGVVTGIDLCDLLDRIDAAVPPERVVVCDGGRFLLETLRRVHVPRPTDYVHTVSFGSIGLGLANAIGAAVAEHDRPVLMICGDGGLMLGGLSELHTLVREGLDVVVVVLNDGAYGAEHIQFRDRAIDPTISRFDWPAFDAVARSMGLDAVRLATPAQVDHLREIMESRTGPMVIDVVLDPDEIARTLRTAQSH